MDRVDLLKHAEIALNVAKQDVQDNGQVLPTLVMVPGDSRPHIIAPVPEPKIIPLILKKENPEAFTWAHEIWIRDQPNDRRRDAIEVLAGSGITRVILHQEYHKAGKDIVFGKLGISSESELAADMFNRAMHDGLFGEIMGQWAAAPVGGRLFRARMYMLDIWIPEGWKMARENDASDGKPRPVFWREKDPHGAVRISTFWPNPGKMFNPEMEARAQYQKGRSTKAAENVTLEEKPGCYLVSWERIVEVPGQPSMKAHSWWVYDREGLIFFTFTYANVYTTTDVSEELESARQIVGRIARIQN